MNCLEFRRLALTDPRAAAGGAHANECKPCAAFLAEQLEFDRRLGDAARVPAPANLAARIVLNQTLHRTGARRRLAYAASAIVALAALALGTLAPRSGALDRTVIAHIVDEPAHLMANDNVETATVARVLDRVGLKLDGKLNNVHFAENCPINGTRGLHLVFAGAKGPVSVLLIPNSTTASRHAVSGHGFEGVMLPTGAGTLAIVGMPGESLATVEAELRGAVPQLTQIAISKLKQKESVS